MYGQASVFQEATNTVYLFGGVVYSRPLADVSSSLYTINVLTRTWAEVALVSKVRCHGNSCHSYP